MELGGLIRSRGFCPSESFVCSAYPAFDRRGAEPALKSWACVIAEPSLRGRLTRGNRRVARLRTANAGQPLAAVKKQARNCRR
jgi:hypothetical protein